MKTQNQKLMYRVMWDWTGEPYNWSDVILMTPKEVLQLDPTPLVIIYQ